MTNPFGVDITYKFYVVSDPLNDTYLDINSISAPDSIYIYSEGNKPTREQAKAGTDNGGLIGSVISAWTTITGELGKEFTIPAIVDPAPNGGKDEYTYWVAVNFTLASSEQVQTVIRALPMRRITAHHSSVSVSGTDLKAIFAEIDSFRTAAQQSAAITVATSTTHQKLTTKGYDWAQLWRPAQLRNAISYKALADMMLSLSTDADDEWFDRYKEYGGIHTTIFKDLKIQVDTDNDGKKDRTESRYGALRAIV